ncbi:MAG: hypothetical protein ACOYMA_00365 [Bacteroidia bacterium]
MTFSNNKQSANLLAQSMTDIMNSNGHRAMFKKIAADTTLDITTVKSKLGQLSTLDDNQCYTFAENACKDKCPDKAFMVGDLAKKILDGSAPLMKANDPAVNAILLLLGVPASGPASNPAVSILNQIRDNAGIGSSVKALTPTFSSPDFSTAAKNSGMLPTTSPTIKPTAASLVNSLVKMANYLGRSGYTMSEAITDNLIKSIVVEAKKKEDKKKKLNKLQEKMMRMKGKKNKTHECEEGDEECEFGKKKGSS